MSVASFDRVKFASVRAAARNIESVTRLASLISTPRPTPGNTNALLHWPMTCLWPLYTTGSNGEPVATRARPSECSKASDGVHSALLVGLLRGKMMGRSQWSAMARMAAGVKSPGWPVVPIRTVGRTLRITFSNAVGRGSDKPTSASSSLCKATSRLCTSKSGRPSQTTPAESMNTWR